MIFESLERESIHKIINIELKQLYARVYDLGYKIEITEDAKDFIVEKGWDEQFGARPLKRAIQKYIEDPLAEEIIKSNIKENDTILLDYKKGEKEELSIVINKKKKKTRQLPASS